MARTNEVYVKMGMAALLPGMVHMLELMQAEVDRLRTFLAEAQQQEQVPGVGEPAADESALERKRRKDREAKRRQREGGGAQSNAQKSYWESLSPAKRKKRLAAMLAGRDKARVALEKAA